MFHVVQSWDDLIKALIVRGIVFLGEQKTPYRDEVDEFELTALHILGEHDGEPMAAARIRFLGEFAKLERIAVREEYRGRNYGHRLVDFMLEVARQRGCRRFKMHAQVHLCDFYAEHGFAVQGRMFKEANIDHYLMVREE